MSQGDFEVSRFIADIEAHTGQTLATDLGIDKSSRNCYGLHFSSCIFLITVCLRCAQYTMVGRERSTAARTTRSLHQLLCTPITSAAY